VNWRGFGRLSAVDRSDARTYRAGVLALAVALFALLLLVSAAMTLTFGVVHLLGTLAVAGLVGWIADLVVPGELPYGWLGAVVAGLVGGWLGALLIGNVGPQLFGVHLIPALLGAALLAFLAQSLGKGTLSRR
jgi:uncharacterized membrane protein YeaQ/YmgE (transglycosylase-associated protein family)